MSGQHSSFGALGEGARERASVRKCTWLLPIRHWTDQVRLAILGFSVVVPHSCRQTAFRPELRREAASTTPQVAPWTDICGRRGQGKTYPLVGQGLDLARALGRALARV